MSTAAAVLEAPDAAHGHPTLLADWRLVVEAWLPDAASAQWDIDEWDNASWAQWRWVDITARVRGVTISRGSDEPHGRPRVGVATITLDTRDGAYSPWNPQPDETDTNALRAAIVVRVALVSPEDGWLPLFTGDTDDWPEQQIRGVADRSISLELVDPFARLASIEGVADPTADNQGDNVSTRVRRLLEESGYPYGYTVESGANLGLDDTRIRLDATDFSGNRLNELYLTADSGLVEIYAGPDGRATVTCVHKRTDPDVVAVLCRGAVAAIDDYPAVPIVAYNLDGIFTTTNGVEHVRNEVKIGEELVARRPASVLRYGRRTLDQEALLSNRADEFAEIALDTRSSNTLRVAPVEIYLFRPDDAGETLTVLGLEFGDLVAVYPPHVEPSDEDAPHIDGWVASVAHQIAPRPQGGVDWRCQIGVDTRNVHNLPGAQL